MEKRKYPRVPEVLAVGIQLAGRRFAAKTRNLSCGGVLCETVHSLDLMTRLQIQLVLPAARGMTQAQIHCVGVVVRQEPLVQGACSQGYLTAIYFSEIAQEDRRRIAEYVLGSMMSHDRRRS